MSDCLTQERGRPGHAGAPGDDAQHGGPADPQDAGGARDAPPTYDVGHVGSMFVWDGD
jgi:hypothetical protein